MNITLNEDGQQNLVAARNSETGKTMTEAQFAEVWAKADIMKETIHAHGVFSDKLMDEANALARTQKFNQLTAENMIRDIFEIRYGQMMNQALEQLRAQEKLVTETQQQSVQEAVADMLASIQADKDTPEYKARDRATIILSETHGISQAAAFRMMRESFRETDGRDIYDVAKALEEKHYQRPERQSQRQDQATTPQRTRQQSHS